MYDVFYGFREKPFSLLPNPEFLYLSPQHEKALGLLELSLRNHAGFCVISGEIGAGKTTLIRKLLTQMSNDFAVGLVNNTLHSFGDLMNWVLLAFDLEPSRGTAVERHERFVDFVIQQYGRGRRTVLIVDEAQNLSVDALEELRMLSNVNADKHQVLQVILVGQVGLRETLKRPELTQFAQRILMDFHLAPLGREDTLNYIRHRILVAGADPQLFSTEAAAAVYRYSGGIPRIINLLCDMTLVYGYAESSTVVTAALVHAVVRERQAATSAPALRLAASAPPLEEESANDQVVEKDVSVPAQYGQTTLASRATQEPAPLEAKPVTAATESSFAAKTPMPPLHKPVSGTRQATDITGEQAASLAGAEPRSATLIPVSTVAIDATDATEIPPAPPLPSPAAPAPEAVAPAPSVRIPSPVRVNPPDLGAPQGGDGVAQFSNAAMYGLTQGTEKGANAALATPPPDLVAPRQDSLRAPDIPAGTVVRKSAAKKRLDILGVAAIVLLGSSAVALWYLTSQGHDNQAEPSLAQQPEKKPSMAEETVPPETKILRVEIAPVAEQQTPSMTTAVPAQRATGTSALATVDSQRAVQPQESPAAVPGSVEKLGVSRPVMVTRVPANSESGSSRIMVAPVMSPSASEPTVVESPVVPDAETLAVVKPAAEGVLEPRSTSSSVPVFSADPCKGPAARYLATCR